MLFGLRVTDFLTTRILFKDYLHIIQPALQGSGAMDCFHMKQARAA
jgi:hypothetical protein